MSVLAPGSALLADKLFALLTAHASQRTAVATLGPVDPVQQAQMARYQDVVYVAGAATSSMLSMAHDDVGPGMDEHPYTIVPNQVQRLYKAQLQHDRAHWDARCHMTEEERTNTPWVDYLRPIIADGGTGHGGLSSVFRVAKLFAEQGAAAVHLGDVMHGGKRYEHPAGKVLAPTSEHVDRLTMTRFAWDILGASNLLIARTDAETAQWISSTIDARDHESIKGAYDLAEGTKSLADTLNESEARGDDLDAVEAAWMENVVLIPFNEAVAHHNASNPSGLQEYDRRVYGGVSHAEARRIAEDVFGAEGVPRWDWDAPRSKEGHYHFKGGMYAAIKRMKIFAPYADLLWLETQTPDVAQAQGFAAKIHEDFPGKWLVYSLSPSFPWGSHDFSNEDLRNFVADLGQAGFVLQWVALAGAHAMGTSMCELSRRFQKDGMLAYAELIQRKEQELGTDFVAPEQRSSASYLDRLLHTVRPGTCARGGTADRPDGSAL